MRLHVHSQALGLRRIAGPLRLHGLRIALVVGIVGRALGLHVHGQTLVLRRVAGALRLLRLGIALLHGVLPHAGCLQAHAGGLLCHLLHTATHVDGLATHAHRLGAHVVARGILCAGRGQGGLRAGATVDRLVAPRARIDAHRRHVALLLLLLHLRAGQHVTTGLGRHLALALGAVPLVGLFGEALFNRLVGGLVALLLFAGELVLLERLLVKLLAVALTVGQRRGAELVELRLRAIGFGQRLLAALLEAGLRRHALGQRRSAQAVELGLRPVGFG
ncbi:hypothetical protein D3C72_1491190 [compost metagenome]